METLLSVEGGALGLALDKLLIKHPQAGIEIFAGRPNEKGDVVRYYYGSWVYENITHYQHVRKKNGEAFIQGKLEKFQR